MFGAFAAGFGFGGGGTFAASYRVYPVSFLDRADAEAGDKLFLPPSALDRLGEFCVIECVMMDVACVWVGRRAGGVFFFNARFVSRCQKNAQPAPACR